MALAANIEMSECRLLESASGQQIFGTKRFDRIGNNRIHMHSMAGLTHDNFRRSSIDYGHIIDTAYLLEQSATARKKVLRLAAFNIYSHNRDDHSKNFSWLMDDSGIWSLAPAYDLCHAYNPDSFWVSQHALSINGKRKNILKDDLLTVAKSMNIKKAEKIISEISKKITLWNKYAEEMKVKPELRDAINSTLIKL